jgi:hypothetical protein
MTKIDLSKGKMTSEVILGTLFIIYLVLGYPTPQPLAQMIHSSLGTLIIVTLFLSLFLFCNPILAILGLFVGFELIRRSEPTPTLVITSPPGDSSSYDENGYESDGHGYNDNHLFEENKKNSFFTASNQFPYTLEEEVVKVMAPPQRVGARTYQDEYQPVLDTIHDAESI